MEHATRKLTLEKHDAHLLIVAQNMAAMEKKINDIGNRLDSIESLLEFMQFQVSVITDHLE